MTDHNGTYWRDKARCRGEDPELWFPVATTGPLYTDQVRRAKNVCRQCPVVQPCREHALRAGESGVWGGTTEVERSYRRQALVST